MKEEGKEKSALIDLSRSLYSLDTVHEPAVLLQTAFDTILQVTRAQAGSLFLWDETAKELVLKIAEGPYLNKSQDARVRLREGIAGWVAHNGNSVLVRDISEDSRFQGLVRARNYHSSSFISLSLLSANKLLGVINITEKECLSPFHEEDFERAQIIAKHLALAYENLKLKRRLSDENDKLHQEIVQLRDSLREKEALASIGKLACSLAHELNNPLDAIRRFVNLALDHAIEDSLGREYLLKAKQGIRRAIQVIRGLLSFSRETRREALHKSDLHSLIEKSLSSAMQNPSFEKIYFVKDFCDKSVYVEDCGLSTVFQNLFDNAHHAMKGAGVINISTHPNGEHVLVAVRDTGCGVSDKYQKRLFEPFFTTKDIGEGTGIGLAICQEIIERSGGSIAFESDEKKGTTFLIKLPYVQNGEANEKNHPYS